MNLKKVLLIIQFFIAVILFVFFLFVPICYSDGGVIYRMYAYSLMVMKSLPDMSLIFLLGLISYPVGAVMIYYAYKYARYVEHKKELHIELCIALTFGTFCLLLFPCLYYNGLGTLASFDCMFPFTLKIMYALSGLAVFINLLVLLSCIKVSEQNMKE